MLRLKELKLNRFTGNFWITFASLIFLFGCKLDKDVNVDLPAYNDLLAIECYLEPNKPIKAYLTSTSSYFDSIRNPLITKGQIVITEPRYSDTLTYNVTYDYKTHKLNNFGITDVFVPVPGANYHIEAHDSKNRTLSGDAIFLPKPKIDSSEYSIRKADLSVTFIVYVQDDPNANNYYRVIMNKDTLERSSAVDITLSDANFQGQRFPVFTSGRFKQGDSAYVRVFNIEKKYYDYLRSVRTSISANGNPFSQPAVIKSTVNSGFGVFTCLSYDQLKIVFK